MNLLTQEEIKKALSIASQQLELSICSSEAKEILDDLEFEFLKPLAICSLETDLCRRMIVFPDDTVTKSGDTTEFDFQLLHLGRNIADLLSIVDPKETSADKWFYYHRKTMVLFFYISSEKKLAEHILDALELESKEITKRHEKEARKLKTNDKSIFLKNIISTSDSQ